MFRDIWGFGWDHPTNIDASMPLLFNLDYQMIFQPVTCVLKNYEGLIMVSHRAGWVFVPRNHRCYVVITLWWWDLIIWRSLIHKDPTLT